MKIISLSLITLTAFWMNSCSKSKHQAHDHPEEESHHHVHSSLMGGTLIEIGDHAFNIEFLKKENGVWSLYILDAHAENFVRIKSPQINAFWVDGGLKTPIQFQAIANPATGETVGETSQFDFEAIDANASGEILIPSLKISTKEFVDVRIEL
jgi:hypothetical protein